MDPSPTDLADARRRLTRLPGSRAAPGLVGALAALLLLGVSDLRAQEEREEEAPRERAAQPAAQLSATLMGQVVSASDARPVDGAVVNLLGAGQGAITDSAGRFHIPRTAAGPDTVEVRFIGYEPNRVAVDLEPDATTRIVFLLSPGAVRVADIEVEIRRAEQPGKLRGFWSRRDRGFGVFITPQEIRERQPRIPSDLLRGIPGVSVGSAQLGRVPVRFTRGARECPPNVFVDGIYMRGMEVDDITPEDVWAVEVYRGPSELPAEFNRPRTQGCGAVIIWTPTGETID